MRRSFCVVTLLLTMTWAPGTNACADDARLVYLDQGWDDGVRQNFYYGPQGSILMPYEWFLALERPNSRGLFRDDESLSAFGYVPNAANEHNPDALPIGFAASERHGKRWFGLTCAACHTGQLEYRGASVRVDGGTSLSDVIAFQSALTDAVSATLATPRKFGRFAEAIGREDRDALRTEMQDRLATLEDWRARSRPAHPSGFGRMDAVHVAFNDVVAVAPAAPENFRAPLAPTSLPCIWISHDLDWVLWNGSVNSTLTRGIGEAIIVFAPFSVSPDLKFTSEVDVNELHAMYDELYDLTPPKWPEDVLGAIDQASAARGAQIYEREGCVRCHANKPPYPMSAPNEFGKQFIETTLTPLEEIGTDPLYATQFLSRQSSPGITGPLFKGTLFEGQQQIPAAIQFLQTLKTFTEETLASMNLSQQQSEDLQGRRGPLAVPATPEQLEATVKRLTAYKTQPLPGIWSTAPYLHNGSVPNLYQLLLPPEQRVKTFTVGNREFDPKHVGYEYGPGEGLFEFDTSVPGNGNTGHTYGTEITEQERWDLIEYLKTL